MRKIGSRLLGACIAAIVAASASHGQETARMAVSPALSPTDAGEAFERAVLDICVASIAGAQRVSDLAATEGMLSPTSDPQRRQQAGASADETVWDVDAARGVVTVREKDGRCAVSVYGPPATPTMILLAAKLADEGFARMATSSTGGLSQSLHREQGGRQVHVILTGSDPGSPGHSSRFSVVTATVFDMKAG